MTEAEFRTRVDETLRTLLDQLDALESDDPDARMTDGNLVVAFDSGGTFMLSQQTPTRELWLSANMRAWHFLLQGDTWVERDTREPMTEVLGHLFSDKLGEAVQFRL